MTNTEVFLSELRTSAWSTSGARFNASRRLNRREWFATLSIACFAAIGVGLAILQKTYAFKSGTPIDNYVTVLAVCIGLFVIVISLIEAGAKNAVKAEALLLSAEELNMFQRKVAQVLAGCADGHELDVTEVDGLRREYEEMKMRCPFNHEPIDHVLFLAQRRLSPEFLSAERKTRIGWCRARWVELVSVLSIVWYFGLFWLVIGLLLWMTPWGGEG
jgi:hypothetical protein